MYLDGDVDYCGKRPEGKLFGSTARVPRRILIRYRISRILSKLRP
jgi:hypothetical protein